MAVGLNKIMIIGNLGTDPEMRYTPSGKSVTSFRMAVNTTFRVGDGERQDDTEWFTVVAWDRLAELVNQYLAKGRRAYIEGRFKSRRWEGQDGQPRVTNEIIATSVLFLDRGGDSVGGGLSEENDLSMPTEAEDLPF
jgi:single-strand DNA-binding protein